MYRKPTFVPHYLHVCSEHPNSCKVRIYQAEARRAQLLCARPEDFQICLRNLRSFLALSGYPMQNCSATPCCAERREQILNKLAAPKSNKDFLHELVRGRRHVQNCQLSEGGGMSKTGHFLKEPNRKSVYLVLPYSAQLATLRFAREFKNTVGCTIPLSLTVAWKMKVSNMRRLYKFNWPAAVRKD